MNTSTAVRPQVYTLDGYGDGSDRMDLARACGNVYPVAESFIRSPSFRMETGLGEVNLVLVDAKYVGHNPTSDEVLAEIANRGLADPTEEDVLRFGKKYPDLQRQHRIVFLYPDNATNPWRNMNGERSVLSLGGRSGVRRLRCDSFENTWRPHCLFAARVPRK